MFKDKKHTSRKIDISYVSAKLISASEHVPSHPDGNSEHCWKPGSLSPSSDDPPRGPAHPDFSLCRFMLFSSQCLAI